MNRSSRNISSIRTISSGTTSNSDDDGNDAAFPGRRAGQVLVYGGTRDSFLDLPLGPYFGAISVGRRTGLWKHRSLRDLGKLSEVSTFPQPPQRGQFVKFLTLESDVVSGEGHRQKRSKS